MATAWSDATITAQTTLIKPAHITEMRTALNAERVRRSLGNASFAETLTPRITPIKTTHIGEIRTGLNFAPLSLTDTTLTAGSTGIKAVHVQELRTKINTLENAVLVGGTTGCNAGCTGLCVSCTGTCTGGCTGCTSCSSCSGTCTGDCTGCSGCSGDGNSCFIAGTKVLMADRTMKNIEAVRIGEQIIGIDGKAHNVIALYPTRLGERSLLKFTDNSLSWSEEHPLWVRHEDGSQYWGVWGAGAYLREMRIPNPKLPPECRDFGLKKRLPDTLFFNNVEYAHVDGWKWKEVMIDRTATSDTVLYDLVTDGPGTMIVNGFVASAFATDKHFDFEEVRWSGI